jgi:recombination associated protein RdgC
MFRNLMMFRFPPSTSDLLPRLAYSTEPLMLRTPGPLEFATRGFVPVIGDEFVVKAGNCLLFAVGTEERLLPASVISVALTERIKKICQEEDRRVGGKERKRLREEVVTDLLPRAFVERKSTRAYVDLASGWLVIDTTSRGVAEGVVSQVREALGRFPAVSPAPEESPRAVMTDWLAPRGAAMPADFSLGSECELRLPGEDGAKWKGTFVDLEGDEVGEHLGAGMMACALGLEFDDRLGFVLTEELSIRKFKMFDVVLDTLDSEHYETGLAELQARLALLAGELSRLQERLSGIFGLSRPEDRA